MFHLFETLFGASVLTGRGPYAAQLSGDAP